MKTIKINVIAASLLGAGTLLMTPMVASAAEAGQGWDAFNTGEGEKIAVVPASAYMGTSLSSAVGQGWDTFNTGDGQKIPTPNPAYMRPPQGLLQLEVLTEEPFSGNSIHPFIWVGNREVNLPVLCVLKREGAWPLRVSL